MPFTAFAFRFRFSSPSPRAHAPSHHPCRDSRPAVRGAMCAVAVPRYTNQEHILKRKAIANRATSIFTSFTEGDDRHQPRLNLRKAKWWKGTTSSSKRRLRLCGTDNKVIEGITGRPRRGVPACESISSRTATGRHDRRMAQAPRQLQLPT